MENLNQSFISKLSSLLGQLTRTNKEFEMVADELEDSSLRSAFDGLSAESSQYAHEIYTELKTLGIPCGEHDHMSIKEWQNIRPEENKEGNDEIEIICSKNENNLTNAYREVLADYFPFPSLKEIMMYQLNGLKTAFLKIRSLNISRVSPGI